MTSDDIIAIRDALKAENLFFWYIHANTGRVFAHDLEWSALHQFKIEFVDDGSILLTEE